MLQNKYLPQYHYSEKHSLAIDAAPAAIFPHVVHLDFRRSWVIRVLFALRGMPARMLSLEGLNRSRFVVLEMQENEEIIIGLIGAFWRPSGNLQKFAPAEFATWQRRGFAKATWNFRLIAQGDQTMVETETRIQCLDSVARAKFARYWWLVRPFSGWIRKEILRTIRRNVAIRQP